MHFRHFHILQRGNNSGKSSTKRLNYQQRVRNSYTDINYLDRDNIIGTVEKVIE